MFSLTHFLSIVRNCVHIWEFFRDSLKLKSNFVKWVIENEGIFKILDQNKTALEWSKYKAEKRNIEFKLMSYKSLTRGIRKARVSKYFKSIKSNQSYGKNSFTVLEKKQYQIVHGWDHLLNIKNKQP